VDFIIVKREACFQSDVRRGQSSVSQGGADQMPGLGVSTGATSTCDEETAMCTQLEGARQAE